MKNEEIIDQIKKFFPIAQYAGLYGCAVTTAEDNYIFDADGKKYLDFLSGASTSIFGYSRNDLINTYVQAAEKLPHSCFVYSPNGSAMKLAKKIINITPGNFEKKVMLGLSASDSIDGAIKAARAFSGKQTIISFKYSYHGSTGYSSQSSGFFNSLNDPNGSTVFLEFPTDAKKAKKVIKIANKVMKERQIAGILFEPILGDGGNVVPPSFLWSELQELSSHYGVVTIADETQSGLCRTGKWWASEHFGIEPDILVIGKGLGAGYIPISATVGRAAIFNSLKRARHVFTYTGHPPSCEVAYKILSTLETQKYHHNVARKGNFFISKLKQIMVDFQQNCRTEIRGMGLQLGVKVVDKNGYPLAKLFATRCFEKGLYIGYFGSENEVLRLHPPFTVTYDELSKAAFILREVFEEWHLRQFPESTYKKVNAGAGLAD